MIGGRGRAIVTGGADSFRRTAIIKSHIPHSDFEIILVF
jgi:hypothetical protein